jgi:tetratricopeptide (TPR) repeat protein
MRTAIAICLLVTANLAAQMEQHDHHAEGVERLGTVSFPTSCTPAAQAKFTRAVALLHSFWYEEAEKAFTETANVDPQCGMAWWGVAMSNYHPVWPSPYSPAELARGVAAAAKAKAVGGKTDREKAYIDAIAAFYSDVEHQDLNTRARAYEAGMQRLTAANPTDDEAAIFYGLSLIAHGMSMPTDKTYAYQKQAAEIFNRLLKTHPDHPGIAHYLIHSFDYPALAPLALNAAYAYAKIAPSSPHALHMPSHIFVRLGMWQETIDSNLKSSKAAREHAARAHPGAVAFDDLHASDYLAYAYLQLGQDDAVRQLVDELAAIKSLDVENFAAYYAMASVPARYALERKRWTDAAALTVRPASFPWDRYAYAEAWRAGETRPARAPTSSSSNACGRCCSIRRMDIGPIRSPFRSTLSMAGLRMPRGVRRRRKHRFARRRISKSRWTRVPSRPARSFPRARCSAISCWRRIVRRKRSMRTSDR